MAGEGKREPPTSSAFGRLGRLPDRGGETFAFGPER